MTGCKGYDLRESDAMIRAHQRGQYAGKIPGRIGLQAERRTENKFIMRGAWLRSKEMEVDHYETEYEGKENSLRLSLPQPSQHSDKAEMADSADR